MESPSVGTSRLAVYGTLTSVLSECVILLAYISYFIFINYVSCFALSSTLRCADALRRASTGFPPANTADCVFAFKSRPLSLYILKSWFKGETVGSACCRLTCSLHLHCLVIVKELFNDNDCTRHILNIVQYCIRNSRSLLFVTRTRFDEQYVSLYSPKK